MAKVAFMGVLGTLISMAGQKITWTDTAASDHEVAQVKAFVLGLQGPCNCMHTQILQEIDCAHLM